MAVICPTVTEYDLHSYRQRMEQIAGFADRVHIDLMDGEFAPTKSPELEKIWWPEELEADLHLMYQNPTESMVQLLKLKPSLVIIHFEADVDHKEFARQLRQQDIKAGLALLQATSVEEADSLISDFDHVMVYSGQLGEHKGVADLGLLGKVRGIRDKYPNVEISWDGGINDQNAKQLVEAGVDVLNVGGFIANADDPAAAYEALKPLS